MAGALYSLARTKNLIALKKLSESLATPSLHCINNCRLQIRCINPRNTPLVTNIDVSKLTDFEKSKNPEEWRYVERCFPIKVVPSPKHFDGTAPSGWIPPREHSKSHPFFVSRTKNYMLPVYLLISFRGSRHITVIKKIDGNIWQLESEIKTYLESISTKYYKKIASRVNEMSGQIRFRGDHVENIKQWLITKGF
ncbi:PREDICTED: probable 39S ribosomal protein L49, mitochondrial [Ceratosolen solmsi marchali]|uniref:Large ribosomal subunit protein mL49 n=1 Tax=Ceratosolen solmsi marchali TaxID=326594 RepID=A0AAJ6YVP6_9HYME|nr:PREDICTED: probable 39S ribosomal protein L49, mitochondrial [Ceratosolen solmsi marchali]